MILALLPFSTSWAQEPSSAGATIEERLASVEGRQRAVVLVEALEDETIDTTRRLDIAREAFDAVGVSDDRLELRLRLGLASVHRDLGEAGPMREHSDRALELAERFDDDEGRARAILYRGHAAYWLSEYQAALDAAREAFRRFRALGDTRRSGEASWLEGATQGRIGAHAEAIEAYRTTLDLYAQTGFSRGVARTRYSIAVRYFFLDRLDESATLARRALDGALETDNPKLEVMCIQLLGNIAREEGQPAVALDFLQRALATQRRLDETSWNLAEIQQNLGDTYIALGELDEAERQLAEASSFFESVGNRFEIASILLSRGRIHNLRGDHDAASPLLDRAHDLTAAIASRPKRSEILHELSTTYAAAGRYREAFETFQRYEALRRELFDEQSERQINQMQTQLDIELKEERIDHLERQKTRGELALERQRAQRAALVIGFASLLAILLLLFNRYRLKSRQALLTSAMRQEQRVSAQLREIDQLKDEFLANTSHQLRTPLYGMIGLVETVLGRDAAIPDETRATLGGVLESGQRLTGLIDDLLDFSKLRRHSLDLNLESVELHALTDVVLTLNRTLAEGRNVELVNTVEPDLPPAKADPVRVQQVLQHLTTHCIRSSTGSRVEVRAEVVEDDLSIQVACLGGQIIGDERERLIAAFAGRYAEDASASIGLDLAMSRWLIEIHGGEIDVDTELEDGAAIRFNLPIAGSEAGLAEPAPEIEPPRASPPTITDDDATTILLVDDE
ncbi:MAG: tetratricopeptide repeat protein, partial [Acidobacteriota bacterium]